MGKYENNNRFTQLLFDNLGKKQRKINITHGHNKTRAKGQKIKKLPVGRKVATPTVLGFRA